MNKEEVKILSEETKEILMNFFILNAPFSKKKFEKLLINNNKYENRVWDIDNTIVNFLLSDKNFKLSNSSLKNLQLISNDWSSVNNQEENSLFLLMKKSYPIKDIMNLLKSQRINIYQKDKNDLYFINYILNETEVLHIVEQAYKGINNFPEIRLQKYFKSYLEIISELPELFGDTAKVEKDKFEKIKPILETPEFKKFNKNRIGVSLEDELKKVETTLNYLSLNSQFKDKSISIKKLKI